MLPRANVGQVNLATSILHSHPALQYACFTSLTWRCFLPCRSATASIGGVTFRVPHANAGVQTYHLPGPVWATTGHPRDEQEAWRRKSTQRHGLLTWHASRAQVGGRDRLNIRRSVVDVLLCAQIQRSAMSKRSGTACD